MIGISGLRVIGSAMRHRNYAIITWTMAPCLVTTWMYRVAVGWLAWKLTGSPTWLGIIAFADLAPGVLISPFVGAWIDRIDPMRPMIISQIIIIFQTVALWAFTISGVITIEILVGLVLILGLNNPFSTTARMSVIPRCVPREDLSAAIAFNSTLFHGSRFIGPAIAGVLLLASGGIALIFALNAVGYLILTIGLLRMDLAPPDRPPRGRGNMLSDIADGYRYVANHAGIGPILVLLTLSSVATRPVIDLLPAFAGDVFHRGADGLAWLTSAVGFGAMIGAYWLAQRGPVVGLTRMVVANILLIGLTLLAFTAADIFWLALVFLAGAGFAMVASGVGTQTLLQSAVEESMRGRVMSLYSVIYRGVPAIGALLMGWLAERFGLQLSLGCGAVICLMAWAWATRQTRTMAPALERDHPTG